MPEADSYANDLTLWFRRMLLVFTVQVHSTITNFMSTFSMATKLRENLQLLFDHNKE